MRIAVNASILDEKPTGVGIYAINVINELAEIVSVNNDVLEVFSASETHLKFSESCRWRRIPRYVQSALYGKRAAFFRFFWNQFNYTRLTASFNVAYNPTTHGSIFSGNQVLTVHDLLTLNFPGQHRFQYLYYRYILPRLVGRARLVVAISEFSRRDIIKYTGCQSKKVRVVYGGYDRKIFFPRPDAAEYVVEKYRLRDYILLVGAGYPHKNATGAIKAYALLPEETRRETSLVITGSRGKHLQELKKQAGKIDGPGQVFFPDYIPLSSMPYFYSAARLLLYPSFYEGFGLPPLEAMACRCPVVVSRVTSLPEVCGNAACYVNPHDIPDISGAILRVLTDESFRRELTEQGLERAKQFHWRKTAEGVYNILREAAAGNI